MHLSLLKPERNFSVFLFCVYQLASVHSVRDLSCHQTAVPLLIINNDSL